MKTIYETDDGLRFDDRDKALAHENTLKSDRSVLDLVVDTDIGTVTIGEFCCALLVKLIQEEECFSGKRPFGNGYWLFSMYKGLLQSGKVKGDFDEDGYIENVDKKKAKEVLCASIKELFVKDNK